jgi:hypothetical protein
MVRQTPEGSGEEQKLTNEVQDLKERARKNKAAKKALEKEKDKTAEKDRNMITVKYELNALRKALKSSHAEGNASDMDDK